MTPTRPDHDPEDPTSLELGQAAAIHLAGEWQLDAEASPTPETLLEPAEPQPSAPIAPPGDAGRSPPTPNSTAAGGIGSTAQPPPRPEQVIEAMVFVGGHPLSADVACAAVRGLTPEGFAAALDLLNRRYRIQGRPYAILPRDGGFVLTLTPGFRGTRERVFGGPREARLGQQALDVLAVVAYRQPVGKAEIDAIRGTDSASVLRQLVRLGLVAVRHRAESDTREVRYGTTSRFLQVFGLSSLDELPKLGETQPAL